MWLEKHGKSFRDLPGYGYSQPSKLEQGHSQSRRSEDSSVEKDKKMDGAPADNYYQCMCIHGKSSDICNGTSVTSWMETTKIILEKMISWEQ